MSHYDYLDAYFFKFAKDAGVTTPEIAYAGIVPAHGDKFYSYKSKWEEAGIHFYHGCMMALLTYLLPFSSECRYHDKEGNWTDPGIWVIQNYNRFKPLLPALPKNKELTEEQKRGIYNVVYNAENFRFDIDEEIKKYCSSHDIDYIFFLDDIAGIKWLAICDFHDQNDV